MAKRRPSGDGMVRKRKDGRWEGRIVVGHKANGEPIFRYVLAKSQKELLDKLHRDMEGFQDMELTEDSRMTLGEWLDRWMEEYGAVTLRPNTLRSYEQYIRCYVKPYLGGKIVSRVTRLDIQKLYRKLKKEGRVHDHPEYGHELSDSMVLRIHAMLHQCLKDAEAAHVVARNPTDGAVVPKASYKPKQILTKEQMEKMEGLAKLVADVNDKYLRLAAEYDNFRKRSQREREQAYTDAVSRAVTALLPTYDNLERALKAETADTEYKKGVELTMTQLTESLKGINVTVIDAAAGTAFDPNFHNAVMHVEDESLGENVIAETFQQGFQIGDKVIRHAMVKVAN